MTQDKSNRTQLTAEDRHVIEALHHMKDFPIRRIADHLNRTPSAIRPKLDRDKTRQQREVKLPVLRGILR
ncbi:helix-turn-helix domain-containing protein [Lacticaseibacillus chiayiensis]|uniref:helix-turn-helix domain-containing protein n=1 Tax=Lacticaseibacillus chiayiensis TaxID=2100821 RepID=UPI003C72CD15